MQLTDDHPKWRWSTFYWAEEDNKRPRNWTGPWRHYHVLSTDSVGEDAPQGHVYCYSPYLEGQSDGNHVNCLSCHSFAAYSPTQLEMQSKGLKYGGQEFKTSATRKQVTDPYFDQCVGTGFFWTVTDSAYASDTPKGKSPRELFDAEIREMTGIRNMKGMPRQSLCLVKMLSGCK
jgi:hypothetical protein